MGTLETMAAADPSMPQLGKNRLADLKLAVGPYIKNFLSLTKGSISNKKFYFDPNNQKTVRLQGAQGNELVGSLFALKKSVQSPAILLLHGSTPAGREMGLYRLLGHKLAELGYVVLTIDQRGFNDSADPQRLEKAEDLDFAADAILAVEYLKSLPLVHPDKIYLLGHSFGGDVAITAGTRQIDVQKILAYGPGRRYEERVKKELAYFCRRYTRYMGLAEMISAPLYLKTIGSQLLESQQEYYGRAGHVPLMLLDGEYESQTDREFLNKKSTELAQPVCYKTIPKADHYANVAFFGRLIIYDTLAFDTFVTEVTDWFR